MKTLTVQKEDGFYVYSNNEHGDLLGVFSSATEAAKFALALRYSPVV